MEREYHMLVVVSAPGAFSFTLAMIFCRIPHTSSEMKRRKSSTRSGGPSTKPETGKPTSSKSPIRRDHRCDAQATFRFPTVPYLARSQVMKRAFTLVEY